MPRPKSLYKKTCQFSRLHKAWRKIYSNGRNSRCSETRDLISNYYKNSSENLRKLQYALSRKIFSFSPATGVRKKKPGKRPRPLVVPEIEDRIVRRAILDTLQDEYGIKNIILNPYSYGGVEGPGVKDAIDKLCSEIENGAKYFIKSDIKNFFGSIPKEIALQKIFKALSDDTINNLLKEAVYIELKNMEELGSDIELFPIHEIGVAQGCCLSPLIGNLLLGDFDREINGMDVKCFRYIDDFLIVGKRERLVRRAFDRAVLMLKNFKMTVYDPETDKDKATSGTISKGLDFLGCSIFEGRVHPSKKSRKSILDSVDKILKESKLSFKNPKKCYNERKSVSHTISYIDNILKGWGNQYSYCNAKNIFTQLDHQINSKIISYLSQYGQHAKSADIQTKRRLLGVHLLKFSKSSPIYPRKKSS